LVLASFTFQQLAVGDDFTCGITTSGPTYCWGANDVGQLGSGNPGGSLTPVAVAGNPELLSIAAAGRTVCAVANSGELLCWGNGAEGELGNGQSASSAVPVAVSGGLQLFAPAIGANASGQATVCASTLDAAYCWGKNSDGEIGDGTKENRNVPTAVTGLPGGAQMAPAGSHTCARLVSAAVFCWGKAGQLGTGNAQASLTPVEVTGGIKFAAIFSGRDHTCGLTDDGPRQAFCWGFNTRGQLGDGSRTTRLAPTLVSF
jgi:alpha-tubulin suppressor-like RCC1 family protein